MEQEAKECVTHWNRDIDKRASERTNERSNERTDMHGVHVYTIQFDVCVLCGVLCLYTFTYYYMIRCASSITLDFCWSEQYQILRMYVNFEAKDAQMASMLGLRRCRLNKLYVKLEIRRVHFDTWIILQNSCFIELRVFLCLSIYRSISHLPAFVLDRSQRFCNSQISSQLKNVLDSRIMLSIHN